MEENKNLPEDEAGLKKAFWKAATAGDLYRQIASYMFWGATALLGVAIGGTFLGGSAFGAVASSLGVESFGLGLVLGASSLVAGAGSLYFSRKSAEQNEQNGLIYSKIHSADIGESVAKSLSQHLGTGHAAETTRPKSQSWVSYVSNDNQRSANHESWVGLVELRNTEGISRPVQK